MKGDMTGFFGSGHLTADTGVNNTEEEKLYAWQLIQQFCPNDSGMMGRMIGVIN